MRPSLIERMRAPGVVTVALLASACASMPATPPPSPPGVSIFVVAHQDDWQLFMNPAAYHAMNEPQEKAVFVHVTAGDAGKGVGGEPVPYYLAREEGALRAVRFMANAADRTVGKGAAMQGAVVDRGGHGVQRHAYANAVVYFLRLPDGFIVENGVFTPHPESLTRLRSGDAASSGTIDQSARYEGWDDLVTTLNDIVQAERVGDSGLTLHIAELDEKLNPRDHPDHRSVALAMEAVATRYPCASVNRHVEYATRRRSRNVSGDDYMIDVGTWAATASGLSDTHAKATWEPEHNAWIGRDYHRTQQAHDACS